MSLDDLNEINAAFWKRQKARDDRLLRDRRVAQTALDVLASECKRGVPIKNQRSLSAALQQAATLRRRFSPCRNTGTAGVSISRLGGLARKRDALHVLICAIVRRQPDITEADLRRRLEELQHGSVIADVDKTKITFDVGNGMLRTAKWSGLKDRLSRAKKELRSR